MWGTAPTWNDVIAALYWGGEGSLGEALETWGKNQFEKWDSQWRVECRKRTSGAQEWSIYMNTRPEANEKYGLKGERLAHIHLSGAGKLNEGIKPMLISCWYVFLKSIPSRTWEEIERAYKDCPPKELEIRQREWYAPGKGLE